jgi:hypothetical protein
VSPGQVNASELKVRGLEMKAKVNTSLQCNTSTYRYGLMRNSTEGALVQVMIENVNMEVSKHSTFARVALDASSDSPGRCCLGKEVHALLFSSSRSVHFLSVLSDGCLRLSVGCLP